MSDDKTKTGDDRKVISLQEDYERRDWAKTLGVSEERLMEAVKAVGDSADAVRQYLKKRA